MSLIKVVFGKICTNNNINDNIINNCTNKKDISNNSNIRKNIERDIIFSEKVYTFRTDLCLSNGSIYWSPVYKKYLKIVDSMYMEDDFAYVSIKSGLYSNVRENSNFVPIVVFEAVI